MNREVYALLYSDSRYGLDDFEMCDVYSSVQNNFCGPGKFGTSLFCYSHSWRDVKGIICLIFVSRA